MFTDSYAIYPDMLITKKEKENCIFCECLKNHLDNGGIWIMPLPK